MRNGQNKRMRGRNRKGQNPLTRVYESNGPDVKVRGTASHVADKYVQLARDAQSSGDPVAAENYYQHAEHYFRLIAAVQEQFRQSQPYLRDGEARDGNYDEGDDEGGDSGMGDYGGREQGQPSYPQHTYQQREQPYPQREREPHGHQPREHRFNRDRDRDRDRDGEQPQHRPPQAQPQPQAAEASGDIERLPAFVTGNAPQPNHGGNGQNGHDSGGPDRFPLHRRRRRRHGGRDNPAGEAGEGTRTPTE